MLIDEDRAVVPFASELGRFGARTALISGGERLTYAELAAQVADRATQLGPHRRLLLLPMRNHVEAVTWYLAALASGNPVLLADAAHPRAVQALADAYPPDLVVDPGTWQLRRARADGVGSVGNAGSTHALHPDLALLLSTSGSTGSPKLVRLSHGNLTANAESIAAYLGITADDRAPTVLPLHYCYGLSVLHSHLLRGASLIVTDRSVLDDRFWEEFRHHGATSLAGVPYTFELLDRVGFSGMRLPSLRYVTQAGGKLPPESVRRLAGLGRRGGWDFYVMYGQTEATARMAYLPPRLAAECPQAIGVPVPGGAFRIDPLHSDHSSSDHSSSDPSSSDPSSGDPSSGDPAGGCLPGDAGELVYSGANVMLGYASTPADLALGATVVELRTGDLARQLPNGLYEVVGRRSRFVKVAGLRVDLGRVEAVLREQGVDAHAAADGEAVALAVPPGQAARAAEAARQATTLPPHAFAVVELATTPRLSTGKIDYPAIVAAARSAAAAGAGRPAGVAQLYAAALGLRPRDVRPDQSFVDLGGTSLTYVAVSVTLEGLLGALPRDWHLTPVGQLAARGATHTTARGATQPSARPAPPRWRAVETSLLLRAAAIVLVVALHVGLADIPGGAHILLGVAGYNAARFLLPGRAPARRLLAGAAAVAVPTVAWTALVLATGDYYTVTNLLLVNKLLGPATDTSGHLWFLEVLVAVLLLTAALLAVPAVARAARSQPFTLPLALTLALVAAVWLLSGVPADKGAKYTLFAAWFFTAGWAAAWARTAGQRAAVTVLVAVAAPGFFDDTWRSALVVAGLALLFWLPTVRVPAAAVPVVTALAGASLWIYLTHWQVFPVVERALGDRDAAGVEAVAVVCAVAVGIAAQRLADALWRRGRAAAARGTGARGEVPLASLRDGAPIRT